MSTQTIREIKTDRAQFMDLLLLADPEEDIVAKYIDQGYLFGLFEDEQPIGEILLLEEDQHTLEVKNIAIAENRQGQGYGKQLIKWAKEFGAGQGYHRLIVGTCNSSFDELAFYQKQGFRFFGVKRDFFLQEYQQPIFENGIQCRDMLMLDLELSLVAAG